MSVIEHLAGSLDRRDEAPNIELAERIAASNDWNGVEELVEVFKGKDRNLQSDSIKVLYEIGERNPALIVPYHRELLALLESRNNRLVWGAMTALDSITLENPVALYAALPKIMEVAETGSVITRDHAVGILIKLASIKQYADHAFSLLIEQLQRCPTNQLPMYAENAAPIINAANRDLFVRILTSRLDEVEKESKRKRIEKVLKKV